MMYIVGFKMASKNMIIDDFLEKIFRCWFNGCYAGYCEYGVFSGEYGFLDVGLTFLSVVSLYDKVDYVTVYDVLDLNKYLVFFDKYFVRSAKLGDLVHGKYEGLLLGYEIVSSNRIRSQGFIDLRNVVSSIRDIMEKTEFGSRIDLSEFDDVSCNFVKLRFRRCSDYFCYYYLFRCGSDEDYVRLYRLIWLLKYFAGLIIGRNIIVKPLWKITGDSKSPRNGGGQSVAAVRE